jgi:hypothetical protein
LERPRLGDHLVRIESALERKLAELSVGHLDLKSAVQHEQADDPARAGRHRPVVADAERPLYAVPPCPRCPPPRTPAGLPRSAAACLRIGGQIQADVRRTMRIRVAQAQGARERGLIV